MSFSDYGTIVLVIAVISLLTLAVAACTQSNKRRAISLILFWTFVFAVLALIPLKFPITIYSYGLMLALAVVVSTLALSAEARTNDVKPDAIYDLVFWAVVGGIVGGRLFYVILNSDFFIKHPLQVIMVQNGGLAWQGGLFGGFIAISLFAKAKKISLLKLLDLIAPYLALGQSIGRIGCFLNGCCYGVASSWGIYFPVHSAQLHPTQLYLSLGYFVIFLILKRTQNKDTRLGLRFAKYLIWASVLRFVVEFFRADHADLFLSLSIYQFICLGIFTFAISFSIIRSKQSS